MGEWRPDHFEMFDVKDKVRPDAPRKTYLQLWIVPAKVAGSWRWSMPGGSGTETHDLTVTQQFQVLSGTVRVAGGEAKVEEGRLDGNRIMLRYTLEVGGNRLEHRLDGRVAGDFIVGTVSVTGGGAQRQAEWRATSLPAPDTGK